jgi:hypothetical protein
MAGQTNPSALASLARGLSAVAARLGPQEAAAACSRAAAALTAAMAKTTDPYALRELAQVLSAVAGRLDPAGAAQTAGALTAAMAGQTNPSALASLARGLSAVAARLGPQEAAAACSRAAGALTAAMARQTNPYALTGLAQGLSAVAGRLDPAAAAQAAAALTAAMAKTTDPYTLRSFERPLLCLTGDPRRPADRAAALVGSTAVFPWPGPLLAGPALLAPNLPPPCRLSTQELVDLLKLPTCVGTARRVVLDQLEGRYGRRFADHWDFVRFARAQNLGLDLTSPPKRPEPAAVAKP